jgi:hypothetical protein
MAEFDRAPQSPPSQDGQTDHHGPGIGETHPEPLPAVYSVADHTIGPLLGDEHEIAECRDVTRPIGQRQASYLPKRMRVNEAHRRAPRDRIESRTVDHRNNVSRRSELVRTCIHRSEAYA